LDEIIEELSVYDDVNSEIAELESYKWLHILNILSKEKKIK